MKTRIALAALAWLAAGTALAQPPHPGRAPDMERLALLLDLDDSQKTQVQTILEAQREQFREEFHAAREGSTERPSREEMRTRREQMRKDTLTKLSAVLNEQQLKKFEALTEWRGGPREKPAE